MQNPLFEGLKQDQRYFSVGSASVFGKGVCKLLSDTALFIIPNGKIARLPLFWNRWRFPATGTKNNHYSKQKNYISQNPFWARVLSGRTSNRKRVEERKSGRLDFWIYEVLIWSEWIQSWLCLAELHQRGSEDTEAHKELNFLMQSSPKLFLEVSLHRKSFYSCLYWILEGARLDGKTQFCHIWGCNPVHTYLGVSPIELSGAYEEE